MAKNMFKKYTESLTREWAVASGTGSGELVLNAVSGEVGVTITARGDHTRSVTLPDGTTLSGVKDGGVGNRPGGAVVAVDGSWLFEVDGVTDGDTGAGGDGTDEGTLVYVDAAGALTTAADDGAGTDNTFVGVIDDGVIVGGVAPVKIGVKL